MQEEQQLPPTQEQLPKKRGRKPKAKTQEISESVENAPKKRGRKPKNKNPEKELLFNVERSEENTQNGPQWRDAPEPSQEPITESDDSQEMTFDTPANDDFAYAVNSDADEKSYNDSDSADDEIPSSYSTSDEDLIQDNYQNSWSADDDESEPDAQESESDNAESVAEGSPENEHQQQARYQKNNGDNRQNRQNNKWRKDNNKFNKNQNQAQQQNGNNRFNNKNQNQNRQNNNRQNQQNGQNKNRQQNQKQNNNQQNRPQKQNKPKWLQQSADADFINPAELFNWDALKSQEAIEKYLAKIYFGKEEPPSSEAEIKEIAENGAETPTTSEILAETPQEHIETSAENAEVAELVAQQSEPAEEIESPAEQAQPSYWEMLEQSNKDLFDKSQDIAPKVAQEQNISENSEETSPTETSLEADFAEDTSLAIADCGILESLDNFNELYSKPLKETQQSFDELGIAHRQGLNKNALFEDYFKYALEQKKLVKISGLVDVFENGYGGAIVFECDNYRPRKFSVFIPNIFVEKYSLARGHAVSALVAPPKSSESCPFAVKICSVMDEKPEKIKDIVAFNDLIPYYPTERIIMESPVHNAWHNVSMRAVDLLSPIGLGQRALIVAPPRTGKTVLMQAMAKSIRANKPNAKLIILLVDERPEEVTDFKRSVDAEVISSTFDEEASNHIHAAEMVISKARRMVESGQDVIILLDSITRLARAYNAMMPNGGRTMSGGVEANALQKPKKFFGSARNIEDGGSLTIIATALVETGSKMDEVIFEEFKGTGNLELHLDRALSDKRIFPAINMEKTGTRKEELLYHPAELEKVYTLRRAMNGVPITESMEMLLQRLKKTKTNVEFLLGLNR